MTEDDPLNEKADETRTLHYLKGGHVCKQKYVN